MAIFSDVPCTFCGCLCDDLEVEVAQNQVVKVKNACAIGRQKLLHAGSNLAQVTVDGKPASLEAALDATAQYLTEAQFPLIYGLSSTTVEAQREAIAIAELVGGTVDNPSSY